MYTLNNLLEDIDDRKTALFIGAGATAYPFMPSEYQLPDGDGMKSKLYKRRYGPIDKPTLKNYEKMFRKEFNRDDPYISPELVWEKCLAKRGEELTPYIKLLDNMFGRKKYTSPNYKFMAYLHFMGKIKQIVTTNFDEKINDTYHLLQSRVPRFDDLHVLTAVDDSDFEHFSEKIKDSIIIYKLHGTLSRPFTIQSSTTDMNNGLSEKKYDALERIFESNTLVVFVGYACNDSDIFKALIKISENASDVKIAWVKRTQVKDGSNIHKVLKAFSSIDKVCYCKSHDFFKELFNRHVDREKIDIDIIGGHKSFLCEKVHKHTKGLVEYTKKYPFPDILYGEVLFPNFIKSSIMHLINSFDMQRLRDIKQLSFAQYKYPSATHTRFSHSLGVAYLVTKALKNSYLKDVDKEDKRNTIYAALLHDIGHGPLGHVLDKFYDRLQKGNEHEKFTKKFIDEGLIDLREVLKKVHVNLDMIKDFTVFKSKNKEEIEKYVDKVYLAWLITDYGLDLDRIDFLMRDLLMTQYQPKSKLPSLSIEKCLGIDILNRAIDDFVSRLCIGTIDNLDRTYSALFPSNTTFPPDTKILYIKDKGKYYGLEELLSFLLGVYVEMYENVYYDDRISCAESMMAKALHIGYDGGDIDRSRLYTFTDSELYAYLGNLEDDLLREIIYSVKYRRLFRTAVEFDLDLPKNVSAVKIEEAIINGFNLEQHDFKSLVVVYIPRKKRIENLFIEKRKDSKSYERISQLISQLNDKLSNTIKGRIFVHPKSSLYMKENKRQELVDLLKNMHINAEVAPKVVPKATIKKPLDKTWDDFY